ncbi:MAG: tetratricopeptide repeat protein [Nitrospinae bacterium]|nr:tetratricopeptide repeat protein [Nitrospinota bacterium]
MSEHTSNTDDYRAIFRSSYTGPDWLSWEEDGPSSVWFPEFQPLREESDETALLDLEKKLREIEETVSLKGREIEERQSEIEGLKEELESLRELVEKSPGDGQINLEKDRDEIARELEEIDLLKKNYDEKLSLLSEREFELNQLEEELARQKEGLGKKTGEAVEQDARLQLDFILDKGKHMASSGQNLQAYFFFRLAVYLHPNNATALNNLAISLFKLGFKEKARTCLGKVLELDPENEAARINLERMDKAREG